MIESAVTIGAKALPIVRVKVGAATARGVLVLRQI
jgi:hypothetical protein